MSVCLLLSARTPHQVKEEEESKGTATSSSGEKNRPELECGGLALEALQVI